MAFLNHVDPDLFAKYCVTRHQGLLIKHLKNHTSLQNAIEFLDAADIVNKAIIAHQYKRRALC